VILTDVSAIPFRQNSIGRSTPKKKLLQLVGLHTKIETPREAKKPQDIVLTKLPNHKKVRIYSQIRFSRQKRTTSTFDLLLGLDGGAANNFLI
jgi:hypothetical protein